MRESSFGGLADKYMQRFLGAVASSREYSGGFSHRRSFSTGLDAGGTLPLYN
jgi:hypothetical protein